MRGFGVGVPRSGSGVGLCMESGRIVEIDDGFVGSVSGFPGAVVAVLLELFEVPGRDVSGHISAVEYRGVEAVHIALVFLLDRIDEVAQVLEDETVRLE